MKALTVRPCSLADANEYVRRYHRHHLPTVGHKFSLAACSEDGAVHGVAITGRPVARNIDDGETLEVNRVCTDGTPNACSCLYGAVRRAARELGYARVVTYTLPEEGGTSLRAAGWSCAGEAGGGAWVRTNGDPRTNAHPLDTKWRWEATERMARPAMRWPFPAETGGQLSLEATP